MTSYVSVKHAQRNGNRAVTANCVLNRLQNMNAHARFCNWSSKEASFATPCEKTRFDEHVGNGGVVYVLDMGADAERRRGCRGGIPAPIPATLPALDSPYRDKHSPVKAGVSAQHYCLPTNKEKHTEYNYHNAYKT